MGFKKQGTSKYIYYDTPVENLFISEYAKAAPGDYVKVYLLGLMYANLDMPFDNSGIAKAFGLSLEEVDKAWDYWKEAGIVNKYQKNAENPQLYDIEFISTKDMLLGGSTVKKPGKVSEKLSSKKAAELFHGIENTTGRLLEAKEPEAVVSWVKDFGIDPSVVLFAYDYCSKNASSNRFRYIEKVVKDWNERGLASVEMVQNFLAENDKKSSFYKGVFSLLGFRRNPTQEEKNIMDDWSGEMGLSLSDIEKACKKTAGISNPNIKYVDKILRSGNASEQEANAEKLRSVEDLYEKLREENSKKSEENRNKIYKKVPGLLSVMEELKASSFRASTSLLGGNKADFEKEKENQKNLLSQKKSLLAEFGFGEDALDPIYTCKKCKDTGLLDDGRRCSCYNLRLAELKNND